MHASYSSTPPQSEPTHSREPSAFHPSAVTVYMLSTCLTDTCSHADARALWLNV